MSKDPRKVITKEVRFSYPSLFKPKKNELNGKDEYTLQILLPKGTDMAPFIAAEEAALTEKFGSDKAKWPKERRRPFKDQGKRVIEVDGKEVLQAGYEVGGIYLDVKSSRKPGVVNANLEPIQDASEIYGGCYGVVSIRAYAYDNKGNRGVSFELLNVLKTRDGEAFGAGRTKPEDDFAPIGAADSSDGSSASDLFG